jgi:hypothetical protein
VHLYYASFPLPDRPTIERAEFRHLHRLGKMQVFGFGFSHRDRGQVAQFFDRAKYRSLGLHGGVLVQENLAAFPRAFAVQEAIVVPTAEAALSLLASGPIQPRRQVVLEHPDAPPVDSVGPAAATSLVADRLGEPYGQVEVVEYRSDQVGVRVSTEGGYLVLTDAHYPGWRAYLDGEETPIYRADYLFRAVALPPGQHVVEFRYEPESLETGLSIARLTVALLALALLASLGPAIRSRATAWLRTP